MFNNLENESESEDFYGNRETATINGDKVKEIQSREHPEEVIKIQRDKERLTRDNERLKSEVEKLPLKRIKRLKCIIVKKLPQEILKLRHENQSMMSEIEKVPQILKRIDSGKYHEEDPKIQEENERLREENKRMRCDVETLLIIKGENSKLMEEVKRMRSERHKRLQSMIQKLPQDILKPREGRKLEIVPQVQEENLKMREEIERLKAELKEATEDTPTCDNGASSSAGKQSCRDEAPAKEVEATMEELDYCWYSNFLGIPVAFPRGQLEL